MIDVGFDEKQAKALANYIDKAITTSQAELVTKSELQKTENTIIKWLIGTAIGITLLTFTIVEFRLSSFEKAIEQNRQAIEQNRQAISQIQAQIGQVQSQISQLQTQMRQIQTSIQRMNDLQQVNQK